MKRVRLGDQSVIHHPAKHCDGASWCVDRNCGCASNRGSLYLVLGFENRSTNKREEDARVRCMRMLLDHGLDHPKNAFVVGHWYYGARTDHGA